MSAEMAARITSAGAALADFHREADAFGVDGALAYRLAAELRSLLDQLDAEPHSLSGIADVAIDQYGQLVMVQLFRDAIAWSKAIGDREATEQEGVWRAVAAGLGITSTMLGGAGEVRHPAPGHPDPPATQLAQIRLVLSLHDWTDGDPAFALQQVDEILREGDR